VLGRKLRFMSKDEDEIRHRGLVEVTDNITRTATERMAERTAAKAKADVESAVVVDAEAQVELEGTKETPTDGAETTAVPVAVVVAFAPVAPAPPPDPDHESELRKLWQEHIHLVPTAYTDAAAYRAQHPPRAPTVDGSMTVTAGFQRTCEGDHWQCDAEFKNQDSFRDGTVEPLWHDQNTFINK